MVWVYFTDSTDRFYMIEAISVQSPLVSSFYPLAKKDSKFSTKTPQLQHQEKENWIVAVRYGHVGD